MTWLCAQFLSTEHGAVGESASNGKAERAVQMLEDQVWTLQRTIEANLRIRLAISHPMIHKLLRNCCTIMNRFSVNPDGRATYQMLHGKRAPDRMIEIGETVYYCIPKRIKHKLDLRWAIGVYLGMADCSNEHVVACGSGTILLYYRVTLS